MAHNASPDPGQAGAPSEGGAAARVHRYTVRCSWSGSTGVGYEAYDRAHAVSAPPAHLGPAMSSDPAFRGDARLCNPEQLLVLAAASCQLLSFLAVAARTRIDVVAYEDEGEGEMPEDDQPMRLTRITLRPRITVAGDVAESRVRHLVKVAHRECFIANSLRTEILVEPVIVVDPAIGVRPA
ncbi:MAG TPA: OsmC family protein [Acidimicrobiales bacterium]|jgi:organic hydroperoxide reductase OsmC/OhrA|nr:OsmC family protein [Acidimicrobiales bacterium]